MRSLYLPCLLTVANCFSMQLEELKFEDIIAHPTVIVVTQEDMDAINPFTADPMNEEVINSELTRWAIHELIEQNESRDKEASKNKKIMAGLGVATGALSLTLVICEIIKVWS